MINKLFILFLLVALPFGANAKDIKKKEKLICKVVLCVPIGLLISASRSECQQAVLDWSIYLATLGPFKKPPKCPILNGSGQRVGNVSKAKNACKYSPNPEVCQQAIDDEGFDTTSPAVCEMMPVATALDRAKKDKCIENFSRRGG